MKELPTLMSYNPITTFTAVDYARDPLEQLINQTDWAAKVQSLPNLSYGREERRCTGLPKQKTKGKVMTEKKSGRRVVQVFVVDTDEKIPLEKSLLYKSEQKYTDLTDQELFFEIDIKPLLEEHNKFRVTQVNKFLSGPGNQVLLESIKIRDLKMVVSTLAQF